MQFRPVVGKDLQVCAVLDTEGSDIENPESIGEYLTFPVHTYTKLNSNKEDGINSIGWQYVFGYVNQFFNAEADPSRPLFTPLTKEDKSLIIRTFALVKRDINEYQEAGDIYKIIDLVKKIAKRLGDLDEAIDLCPKLYSFVVSYIPIGLMANAGNRPQDKPELTFYEEDVKNVTTITVLCKLFSPIFGTIIAITKKYISSNLKDVHCASILSNIIERRFKDVTEKLKFYIEHTTIQIHKEDKAASLVFGYDMNSLAYHMYCQLLVRQLVNVNLAVTNSNLMSYIIVSAKRSIVTIQNSVNNTPTTDRTPISSESDDEGNIAQLETDSMTSKKTTEIDALISAAVLPTIMKFKNLYSIEDYEYDECLKFYQVATLHPSKLNEQLNSLVFGQDFGGSIGIKMLRFNEYSMITALVQMIIMQHSADPAYIQLGHLITAKPSVAALVASDELNDNIIWLQVSASAAYKNCRQRFLSSTVEIKNKEWEQHIQSIIKDITVNHYVYNTAPYLWEWLGHENMNGKIIPIDKDILVAYCDFYDWFMTVREEAVRHGGIRV